MTMTISGSGTITGLSAGGLPDATIVQADLATGVAGTGPAFSAYLGTNQTIANATYVKLQINTEVFDTNNNFDKDTNYRFQPTVAGYYQVSSSLNASGAASGTFAFAALYKNGTVLSLGSVATNNPGTGLLSVGSFLVYMNGTTDYLELYAFQNSGAGLVINNGSTVTYFQASMVRAA